MIVVLCALSRTAFAVHAVTLFAASLLLLTEVAWAPLPANAEQASLRMSFSTPVNISNTPGLSQAPVITVAPDGTLYVVWEERALELLLVSRSADDGRTFTTPHFVVPGSADLSFDQARLVAPAPSDVRMVFTSFDTLFGGAEIVYARSVDGATTFPQPVVVSSLDAINSFVPDIAVGENTIVAWSNMNLFTGQGYLSLRTSADAGASFTAEQRLDASNGNVSVPRLATDGGNGVFAAWMQNDDPLGDEAGWEVLLARSGDGGATFDPPLNVSAGGEKSWEPAIAADGAGNVCVAWPEGTFALDMKLMSAVSHDGGASFSVARTHTLPAEDVLVRLEAAPDGTFWLAWMESSDVTSGSYRSYVARSTDGCETFSAPVASPGGYEIAAASRDVVFFTWNPPLIAGDVADIFVSRGEVTVCADADDDGRVTARDALVALRASVGVDICAGCRCDVNGVAGITVADALGVLRLAVGQSLALLCPACG